MSHVGIQQQDKQNINSNYGLNLSVSVRSKFNFRKSFI